MIRTSLLVALAFAVLASVSLADPVSSPVQRARLRATHVPPERTNLRQYLTIPNTYYDRPRFRYPYYDQRGVGRLLWGYGGQTLYKYDTFQPLEGHFRKD